MRFAIVARTKRFKMFQNFSKVFKKNENDLQRVRRCHQSRDTSAGSGAALAGHIFFPRIGIVLKPTGSERATRSSEKWLQAGKSYPGAQQKVAKGRK